MSEVQTARARQQLHSIACDAAFDIPSIIQSQRERNSIDLSTKHGHRAEALSSKRRKLTNIIKKQYLKKTYKQKEKRNNEYHRIPFRHILPRYFSATRPSRIWQWWCSSEHTIKSSNTACWFNLHGKSTNTFLLTTRMFLKTKILISYVWTTLHSPLYNKPTLLLKMLRRG